MTIKIFKDNGEQLDELRQRLIDLINEYSDKITGYEMVGVVDVVRNDCHRSIEMMEDEDGK